MAGQVIDVAVFTNVGIHSASNGVLATHPPLSVEVCLGQGVSIAPILPSVANYVLKLCSPHDLRPAPVNLPNALYAFIRGEDTDGSDLTWDRGGYIQTAITLSRLAHPTSIGFEGGGGGQVLQSHIAMQHRTPSKPVDAQSALAA